LNVAGFRQMCGRAGRMGLDAKVACCVTLHLCFFPWRLTSPYLTGLRFMQGEAILMIMNGNKTEKNVADHLLTADVDPLRSHLHIAVGT